MGSGGIFAYTVDHFLAPVMPFVRDPSITEIMINSHDEIYIERGGRLEHTDAKFVDEEAFLAAINNVLQFTGKRLTTDHPLVDARLPDGSRVHVVLRPLSRFGTCMTIRKFSKDMYRLNQLIEINSLTQMAADYLRVMVLAEKNLLVSGGTSSGKTVLLNALSEFIPEHQRIVVIEDSAELALQQDHVVSLEGRGPDRYGKGEVNIRDLFKSSLRLRPDRIIIGEVRGGEALDMIQAMTSGHAGSMSTLHASTPLDALNRLETLAMMSKVELPLYALRSQVASAIDLIVQVTRFPDGRRGLTMISEVLPLDAQGRYAVTDMFRYELAAGLAGKQGQGALVWTKAKSIYRTEPKVHVLFEQTELSRPIFEEPADAAPREVA
ncbi:MAG: CpaF family protein [Phycisphaerae bacterium]|nr:CpaF family protein [Phycisphaerae bacterium]